MTKVTICYNNKEYSYETVDTISQLQDIILHESKVSFNFGTEKIIVNTDNCLIRLSEVK